MIDARIRRRHGDLAPLPAPSWSAQVPQTDDPGRRRFLTQLAAAMDDRRRRIGEHAAASTLPWAVAALGAPPDDPAARLDWQGKAAAIGAYRELSGHDHPDDPIGPEPATGSPDLRAAWHEARAALTLDETGDIRHLTDGQLLNLRAARPDDARAPLPAVGKLRQARAAARDANLAALRAHAEASAARRRGEHDEAARQETLAASYQAMRDAYRARETELDTATRDQQATERERAGGSAWPRPPTPSSATATRASPGPRSPPPNRNPPPGAVTITTVSARSRSTPGTAGTRSRQPAARPCYRPGGDLPPGRRSCQAAPRSRRQARRPPPADHPSRSPRPRHQPRLPAHERSAQDRDPPAAQARDPAVVLGPGTSRRPRP